MFSIFRFARLCRAIMFALVCCLLAAALTACGNTSSSSTEPGTTLQNITATAAADVQTLSGSIPAIVAALQATGQLSADQASQVTGDASLAQSAAATLAAQPSIPTDSGTLQQFEGAINDLLAIAAVVAPAVPEVQAAEVIVPLIEVGANLVASQVTAAAAPAPAPAMTPDQARAILKAAAKR